MIQKSPVYLGFSKKSPANRTLERLQQAYLLARNKKLFQVVFELFLIGTGYAIKIVTTKRFYLSFDLSHGKK